MDKQEFLLLIPAIVFGAAIVDLLKIFQRKRGYYELMGWGIYLLLAISWLWYETFDKLDTVIVNKGGYYLIIIQAILYAAAAHTITPEEKDIDTKEYFLSIKKSFFITLTLIVGLLLFFQYAVYDDGHISWARLIAIPLFLSCAFIDNAWLRNTVLVFFSVLKLYIIFTL